jgi:hypothetical protein
MARSIWLANASARSGMSDAGHMNRIMVLTHFLPAAASSMTFATSFSKDQAAAGTAY